MGGINYEPSPASYADLRQVASTVAIEAAEFVRNSRAGYRRFTGSVTTKSSETDVVTAIDRETEQLIRARLAQLRPADNIIGEELGNSGNVEPAQVCWVLDPIDGTVNYLYGFPYYAVSVGAQIAGRTVAGAVVEPASQRVWTAARGNGAELDGQSLAVSPTNQLKLALVATGFSYSSERRDRQAKVSARLAKHIRDTRRTGSAALDLCAVAAGWVDAYWEHGLQVWDWAAAALIAEEAGALVQLPCGQDSYGLGADCTFAATPGISQAFAELLRHAGAATV